MITKIIACSDIHFKNLKGIEDLKNVLKTFIKQCKDIVKTEGGKEHVRIVVAGDIFDQKINVTNESILAVHWFFSELNKICKTIVIAGNHDYLVNNTNRINSLTPLFQIGEYKNLVFLDDALGYKSGCYVDDNVVWCLYSSFTSFTTPNIIETKIKNKDSVTPYTYVGLIHADVNGAITVTNYVSDRGIDPNVFEDCDFVIAGHIHKRQELKKNGVKIVYCSSIMQKDMGETVTDHGFVLWDLTDTEDYTYEHIDVPNPDCGFYKFEINSIEDIENDYEEIVNL